MLASIASTMKLCFILWWMFCYYLFNSMMWQAVMTVFLICIFLTKWSNVAVKYFFSHRGTTTWDFRLLCWFFIPIFYWIFLVVISFFLLWHHITLLDFPAESVHMVIHRGDVIYITRDYIVRQTKKLIVLSWNNNFYFPRRESYLVPRVLSVGRIAFDIKDWVWIEAKF